MIKTMGYYIFALVYYLCRLFPQGRKRVFCIMTHDDGDDSNVRLLIKELERVKKGYTFSFISKSEANIVKGFKSLPMLMSFFFKKPYLMARSSIILMDNVFLPMAYIRVGKNVKVVQLWHGTGTIKKFGQDSNTGRLKELENRANRNITHLIVNNQSTARLYAKAFGVGIDKLYPVGLPKTDDILYRLWKMDGGKVNKDKELIYKRKHLSPNQKLILYAPTFRDSNIRSEKTLKQVKDLARLLPDDYVLGVRLHPFVAKQAKEGLPERVCNLSDERSLTSLLMAADILITDYSSIVFEYCITKKPMIFYAYDLDEFSDQGRGFYEDYINYVPGPVARTSKEVIDIIKEERYSIDRIEAFNAENFPFLDGKAASRIIDLITNSK